MDLSFRHSNRLVELLITRPGLFEASRALLCNQCLLPQAVSKSQFKTKSKTCQPAFCLCGYSIQQISLREARTLFTPLTFLDLWFRDLILSQWSAKQSHSTSSQEIIMDGFIGSNWSLADTTAFKNVAHSSQCDSQHEF